MTNSDGKEGVCDCYIVNFKFAEDLEQIVDVLLLDQNVCRSHYTGNNQSPGEDRREHSEENYQDGQTLLRGKLLLPAIAKRTSCRPLARQRSLSKM